jgi:GT2 family glycosyltransferase
MSLNKVSFIIPSYNGYDLLKVFLPSLCDIISREKTGAEIIVVDDASTDNSVAELRKLALPVRIVTRDSRGGFTKTCNEGAKYASGSFLFFLNNDMTFGTQEELIGPVIKHFDDDDVFAVAPSSMTHWDGKLFDEIPTIGKWEKGFLNIFQPGFTQSNGRELFYASGGCMCVRKDRYFTLDGFDELFSPFYFEDVDLCWRARKRGWKILHEPSVQLYHKSHETINRLYNPIESNTVYWKNYFLFIWKNINDPQLRKEHFKHLTDYIYEKSREGQATLLGCKLAMRLFCSQGHKKNVEEINDKELLFIVRDE